MVTADIIDGIRCAIGIEFQSVRRTFSEIADEPDEGSEVSFAWVNTGFCKFAYGKKDIGASIICEVE